MQRIFLKPPITVKALAECLEVKPYEVIAKLISQSVFPAPGAEIALEPATEAVRRFGYELVIVHDNG